MSAPPIEYGYVDGVEDLSDYRPCGYCPIHIDDRLDKRYRIVHKLGYGTYSAAWPAVSEETSKYIAIKVGIADAARTEVNMLSHFATRATRFTDFNHEHSLIPVILDRFDLSGPNSTHPCLATLPARCSLLDAKDASGSEILLLHN